MVITIETKLRESHDDGSCAEEAADLKGMLDLTEGSVTLERVELVASAFFYVVLVEGLPGDIICYL